MNVKNNFLCLIIGLLMTFLLPNDAMAAFTFSAHDTQGKLLSFTNPVLIAGSAVVGGAGTAAVGAKFKYANVITVDGIQVDAIVSVDNIVNMTITKFDDPAPKPIPKDPTRKTLTGTTVNYVTSFGVVVPEGAIFAPQLTALSHTADAHVDFTISFQDTAGKAVVLQNVYNNSLDDENVEYNEFGGFNSFIFSSDYKTNILQHMVASAGLGGKIRFSNSNCVGNSGLYITDSSRVQTKFGTITSLKLTLGQFANGTAPTGVGSAVSTCTNSGVRYYGAIFAKDAFVETGIAPIETTAPTVELLTTSNTKPTIGGTLGGIVTIMSPAGSPLAVGETFSVSVNGVTYGNTSLTMSGANWTLNIPTALAVGTYEVSTARTGGLIDQSNNELIVTPVCNAGQVLNLTLTACVIPSPTDTVVCHTGDVGDKNGDGVENILDDPLRHYIKEIIPPTGTNGHETHIHDSEATNGVAGKECPDDTPICSANQVLDTATKQCITAISPAVYTTATTSLIPAVLTGTVGTSTSVTITVKNAAGTAVISGGAATITGAAWSYTTALLPAGIYDVVATGNSGLFDSTTNELTVTLACALPQVFNSAGTACITPVVPTVNSANTTDNVAASLSGTIGTSTSLTISVNGVSGAATINGTTWTYTPAILPSGTYNVIATGNSGVDTTTGELVVGATAVPTVTATTTNDKVAASLSGTIGTSTSLTISVNGVSGAATVNSVAKTWTYTPAILAAGTYNVTATGNGGLVDTTSGELVVSASVIPTVTSGITTTTAVAPTLTGTVGTSTSLTITINSSPAVSGAATINGTTWSYTPAVITTVGTYNITATGDSAHGSLVDTTTGELTVTQAPVNPTVDSGKTATTTAVPTVSGTFGTSTTLTITAKHSTTNAIYAINTATKSGSTTTWSVTGVNMLPAGTYDVIATGETGLVDTTSGELVVSQSAVKPTVDAVSTTTSVAPPLTGTLGSSTSLIITVKNSAGTVVATSSTITPSGTTWSYTPAILTTAGTYNVTATGDTPSGGLVDVSINELTVTLACTSPAIPNSAGTSCVTPPTVTSGRTATTTTFPTLTGTFGTSSSVTITVKSSTGAIYAIGSTQTGSGSWSATGTTKLPVGIYDVIATGNTAGGGLVGTTLGALTVTDNSSGFACTIVTEPIDVAGLPLNNNYIAPTNPNNYTNGSISVCAFGSRTSSSKNDENTKFNTDGTIKIRNYTPNGKDTIWQSDKTCPASTSDCGISATTVPTVTPTKTTDLIKPALSGTVGTSSTVTITIGSLSTLCPVTYTGTAPDKTWACTPSAAIPAGTYDVIATGTSGTGWNAVTLVDITTNELTVTKTCTSPATLNAAGTACESLPTVTLNQTATDTAAPTLAGTFGTSTSLVITAKNLTTNVSYAIGTPTQTRVNSTTTWSVTGAVALPSGTYDVIATGNTGLVDNTSSELSVSAKPTVDYPKTFTDKQIPTLTGTYGSSSSVIITVKDSSSAIQATSAILAKAIGGTSTTTWSYTLPAALTSGTYDVVATGNTGLVDNTAGELIISQTAASPTIVCPATVTDAAIPTITGTFGTGSPLTITVKDSSGAPKATGTVTNSVTSASTPWSFNSTALPTAGIYTATATGIPTTLTASCTFAVTQTPIVPTVATATTTDLVPAYLSGTSGTSPTLTITISGNPSVTCPAVIDTVAKTWTCTASAPITTAGNYTVTATGTGGTGTGTLTVTPGAIPTVNIKSVTNKEVPVLSGDVGASTALTITIKSTPPVTGAAVITGSGTTKKWTFTPTPTVAIPVAGTYDVVALGETGLTDNTPTELTVTTSVDPTIETATTTERIAPLLTGTTGSSTSLIITIQSSPPVTGNAVFSVDGKRWTFTPPAAIAKGTYNVVATGDAAHGVLVDTTPNELTVTGCTALQTYNAAGTTCVSIAIPTIVSKTTTDKIIAPTLTGTVGSSLSLAISVNNSAGVSVMSGAATIPNGFTTWSFTPTVLLPAGIYDVVAAGDSGLVDTTSGELKVTISCTLPDVPDDTGIVCSHPTPTVTPKTEKKENQPVTIIGTVGSVALTNGETFTVTVNGVTYTQSSVIVTGINWSLPLPILSAGTYDVVAFRAGKWSDTTNSELIITDKIDICASTVDKSIDKSIERSDWVAWKEGTDYYLGKCVCVSPDSCTQPSKPTPLTGESGTAPALQVSTSCDGGEGDALSYSPVTGVTIKLANIVNASTENGTFETLAGSKIMYGIKTQGSLSIASATKVTPGHWTGVTMTDVAIDDVYIDGANDTSPINVKGGVTKPNTPSTMSTATNATITKGVITAGTDADGKSVRGNFASGTSTAGNYTTDIRNTDAIVVTKGKRVHGAIMNAEITGAEITTINGVTYVNQGTIVSGDIDFETASPLTFGTVTNAIISSKQNTFVTNTSDFDDIANLAEFSITNPTASVTHCVSKSAVGASRGQLNWKEVVKE
ncbi:MAG: hypothetical protein WCJ11_07660 [Methylococcaceae bacterium]